MRILAAEDDPIARRLLYHLLKKWGHDVVLAAHGLEAWNVYQNTPFQMVISDWMMPHMDGIELIKQIRACDKPSYVYTILLTSKGQKDDLIYGMEAGADDFLVKPMDPDELKVKMRAGERIIQLEQNLAQRNNELNHANELMRKDLEAAAKIQESLLPKQFPSSSTFDISWIFKPCDELAGDFLNVFMLDENHLAFYILDVSGHGVSAALLSFTLSRLLSSNPQQSNLLVHQDKKTGKVGIVPPAEVARRLNQRFPINPETGQFFTFIYGIFNLKNKKLHFVSAGHPGLIYLSKNAETKILETPGLPVGVLEGYHYEEQYLDLSQGDKIVLYSDGIVEATNEAGNQLGKNGLIQKLTKISNHPLKEYLDGFLQDLKVWSGSSQFDDDVTMLALEVLA